LRGQRFVYAFQNYFCDFLWPRKQAGRVKRYKNGGKILVSICCGVLVGAAIGAIHWTIVPHERQLMTHIFLGDLIAALSTMIVCLAIQLRQEEVHFASAMSRAAIVSELNHHVRNAVFPLCLAVQKSGDKDASQLANEAVERINVALKEATADAISGRASYAEEAGSKNGSLLVH
jgi:hypothetical protein